MPKPRNPLRRLVEDKCLNGYGVDLKQLELLRWKLLNPLQAAKAGDLTDDITDDPNFLGCLQIPMQHVDGSQIQDLGRPFYRYRLFWKPSDKETFGGVVVDQYKKKRYRQAPYTQAHAFLSQNLDLKSMAKDVSEPVYLIEGEPKCMAMAMLGYFTVGLSGVEMFAVKGDPLPELLNIEWAGREVVICYDNDWHTNEQVRGAIQRVGRQVMMLGGIVYVVDLPEDGPKGIDEYLIEFGPDKLEELINDPIAYDDFATFDMTTTGIPRKNAANVQLAFMKLGHDFQYNLLADRAEVVNNKVMKPVDDALTMEIMTLIDVKYKFQPPQQMLWNTISYEAHLREYHPVRDYLTSVSWDKKPRIDTWLTDCFGADDTPLTRAIARLTLMGAVARAMKPGIKYDTVTILQGKQGTYKSTALRALCPDETWFTDGVDLNHAPREFIEHTLGRWIVEASELDHMTKGDVGRVKANVSRQEDTARAAYARVAKTIPRGFVIIGTVNAGAYLKDLTGNRRFYPVSITKAGDIKWLKRTRDQLWSEAKVAVEAGEDLYLSEAMVQLAEEEQETRTVHTAIFEQIEQWFGRGMPGKVAAVDIWFGLDKAEISKRTRSDSHDIREGMYALDFKHQTIDIEGKKTKGYSRNANADPKVECFWRLETSNADVHTMKYLTRPRKKTGPKAKVAKIDTKTKGRSGNQKY